MHAKKSVLSDIWQNTILLAGQTGALASSFSNMPESWGCWGPDFSQGGRGSPQNRP